MKKTGLLIFSVTLMGLASVLQASLSITDSDIVYNSAIDQYYYEYTLTYADMASVTKFNSDAQSSGVTVNTISPRGVGIIGNATGYLTYAFNFNNGGTGFVKNGHPLYIDSVEIRDNVVADKLSGITATSSSISKFWTNTNTKSIYLSEAIYPKTPSDTSEITYKFSDNPRILYYRVDMATTSSGVAGWNYLTSTSKNYFKVRVNLGYLKSPANTYAGGDGSVANPFKIATASQLVAIGSYPGDWNKNFELINDIDLSGYPNTKAYIAWNSINYASFFDGVKFSGKFDGKNHIIRNMKIQPTSKTHFLGFFGRIDSNGIICNLGIENFQIDSNTLPAYFIGGLCGANSGSIENCHSTGQITGYGVMGGLCGKNVYGSITNCWAVGMIAGNSTLGGLCGEVIGLGISNCRAQSTITGDIEIGGLIGVFKGSSQNILTISNCYATGAVNGDGEIGGLIGVIGYGSLDRCWANVNVTGRTQSGGLFGFAYTAGELGSSIQKCHAMGKVTAGVNPSSIGGFCGRADDYHIIDCYSLGNVIVGSDNSTTDTWTSNYIGGFAGQAGGEFTRCYSAGSVACGNRVEYVGGFCGANNGIFTSCFWDTTTSMRINSSGSEPAPAGVIGMSTSNMQTRINFTVPTAGWDFTDETANGTDDTWTMIEGETYPRFSWECLKPSVHDINGDCIVDLLDFTDFASVWLSCNFGDSNLCP